MIINTCSIASFEGQEGMGAYTAAKSALLALTLVWARDLSKYAIRVNGVAPGFMATPMVGDAAAAVRRRAAQGQRVPQARRDRRRTTPRWSNSSIRTPADQRRSDPPRRRRPPARAHHLVDELGALTMEDDLPSARLRRSKAPAGACARSSPRSARTRCSPKRPTAPATTTSSRSTTRTIFRSRAIAPETRRGSAGGGEDRQPVPAPAVADQPGQEPRLWRLGAAALGQRGDGPQPDEEDRVRRAVRRRHARAGRRVLRPLRLHPGATICRSGFRLRATRGAR